MAPKKLAAVNTVDELEDIPTPDIATPDKKPVKSTKKRAPRVKKVKVNPRTPSVVKVKIRRPTLKGKVSSAAESDEKPQKYGIKDLGQQHLIELANEVAHAQLVNNKSPKSEVKVVKKRGRKPKTVGVAQEVSETANAEKVKGKGKRRLSLTTKAKKPAVSKTPAKRKNKGETITLEAKVESVPEQKPEAISTGPNETMTDTVITPVKRPRGRPRLNPTTAPIVKPITETVPKQTKGKKQRITRSSIVSPTPLKPSEFDFASVTPKIEDAFVESVPETTATIDSRKTSVSDTFSWAQDISSSSISTPSSRSKSSCVCLNGTLPVIEVVDCMKHRHKHEIKKAVVTKKRKIGTKAPVKTKQTRIETATTSAPSSPSSKSLTSSSTSVPNSTVNLAIALGTMRQTLNSLDSEFLNWVSSVMRNACSDESVTNEKPIKKNTLKVLPQEAVAIKLCQNRRPLSVNTVSENSVKNDSIKSAEIAPKLDSAPEILAAANEGSVDNSIPLEVPEREESQVEHDSFSDIVRQKSYEVKMASYADDDDALSLFAQDDALSLFAQSITELDSPRFNNPVPRTADAAAEVHANKTKHNHEPIQLQTAPTAIQPPKQITLNKPKEIILQNSKTKIVCEKQNADSTSIINKEEKSLDADNFLPPPIPQLKERQAKKEHNLCKTAIGRKEPYLISSMFPTLRTSVVFKGYCFFNLASNCQKNVCRFRHCIPDKREVIHRLETLTDDYFIMEYLLLRKYPKLQKTFLECFATICNAKNLTNVLIEMSMDVFTAETTLKTQIVEVSLLHLNDKLLDDYKDLLMHLLDPHTHVCDMFMKAIADTQNFTRFKPVFVNLTNVMVQSKLQFNVDVAKHIFERVCILPYEESLSRALIKIIKNTNAEIFNHPFMSKLEDRLAENNRGLYSELLECKALVPKPIMGETMAFNMNTDGENKRYTSPDTTHLDALQNKSIVDTPLITRTVNSGQTRTYITTPSVSLAANFNNTSGTPSPSSDVAEDYKRPDEGYRQKYKGTWRRGNGASYQAMPRIPSLFSTQLFRPPGTRGRYVARGSPGIYPRLPRPGFY